MKYSNSEILKELKNIERCSKENKNDIEKIANCIYANKNSVWIRNYLLENNYITNNYCSNNRYIPFLTPYWNDFIKNNWVINCFLKDYRWSIWILITIITWLFLGLLQDLLYIITK